MRSYGKRPSSRYKEASRKTIVGTRFHELFFSPLPSDASLAKVKDILQPTGVQCKDVRIHKGGKGCSAFVVFHCDSDAAAALKAFRSDPLFIQNKRIEVRYTMDYSNETTNHSQEVTARIKQSFSWMAEHNISVRELPKELENLVGTINFTDHINTNFSCNDRHTECAFFSAKTKSEVDEESHDILPVTAPESAIYKPTEILQLYKKSQEPVSQSPKISKSSKKKSAKKRQALAKIEAELTRQANIAPLQPGMGRGFCQQRPRSSAAINRSTPNIAKSPVNKPCAVICPTKREVIPTFRPLDKSPESSPEKVQGRLSEPRKENDRLTKPTRMENNRPPNLTKEKNMFSEPARENDRLFEPGRENDRLFEPGRETNRLFEPGKEKSGLPESARGMGRGRGIVTVSADLLRELSKY